MCGRPVASQLDQVLSRFGVQEAGTDHRCTRIASIAVVKRFPRISAESQYIIDDCLAAGRVPVIDRNTRRDTALKAEIAAECARRRLIKIPDPRDPTYKERST